MIPLDELRDVERAAVFKKGVMAGSLSRRPEGVVFSYTPDYLTHGGAPVATTLPMSPDPVTTHAPGALPAFFSGMLPEGRRLSALRTAVKTSADDEFTLLLAVGADTIGDVQVVASGTSPEEVSPTVEAAAWAEVRFTELFAASVGSPESLDRVALPGVQDKLSARMISVPVARAGERYLLKLNPPEFPHLVANEAFFLEAARASGLDAAEARVVHDAEGVPGLLVRRFDRARDDNGDLTMLGQEDGCQVLARYPADKYRVTTEEVIGALSDVCQARPVAALGLLRQFAFAYLTCNGDAHAKNFSVLQNPDGEWRVSPAYDVPASHPYGDVTMALPIDGRRKEDIGRASFLALGATVGLRARAVERGLDELCDRVDSWIDGVAELPFDPRVTLKLRRAIEYRRERLGGS